MKIDIAAWALRLKLARMRLGYSQTELADALNTTREAVALWESPQPGLHVPCPPPLLAVVAERVGVTPDEFGALALAEFRERLGLAPL